VGFLAIGEAVRQGAELLGRAAIQAPRLTAQVLLCHALHCERSYLFAHPEQPLTELQWIHYGRHLHERLNGKPTQYIIGEQEFYGRPFRVTPDVLIPRPETEHVVEAVLPLCQGTVVDVGCGSGAIAITLALETRATVLATDISGRALAVAQSNAHALKASVQFLLGDLLSAFADGSVALVVSNPPYVSEGTITQREVLEWEPRGALFAGPDGLDVYRRLIPEARRVLRPGGSMALELGFTSLPGVLLLLASGWREPRMFPDLAGIPRVLVSERAD